MTYSALALFLLNRPNHRFPIANCLDGSGEPSKVQENQRRAPITATAGSVICIRHTGSTDIRIALFPFLLRSQTHLHSSSLFIYSFLYDSIKPKPESSELFIGLSKVQRLVLND